MTVFVVSREDGHYYGSYEVCKVVYSEKEAKRIVSLNSGYRYEEYKVE